MPIDQTSPIFPAPNSSVKQPLNQAITCPMAIGILALQGCVEPHADHLRTLGVQVTYVRTPKDLDHLAGLILPGGESTTMLRLIDRASLWQPLVNFGASTPCWGVCAGAILLASEVENPKQPCLGLLPIKARRNHYGSQLDSFSVPLEIAGFSEPLQVDFIRAPLISPLSSEVIVKARHDQATVFLEHGRHMATSFHPELGKDSRLHQYFVNRCAEHQKTAV